MQPAVTACVVWPWCRLRSSSSSRKAWQHTRADNTIELSIWSKANPLSYSPDLTSLQQRPKLAAVVHPPVLIHLSTPEQAATSLSEAAQCTAACSVMSSTSINRYNFQRATYSSGSASNRPVLGSKGVGVFKHAPVHATAVWRGLSR